MEKLRKVFADRRFLFNIISLAFIATLLLVGWIVRCASIKMLDLSLFTRLLLVLCFGACILFIPNKGLKTISYFGLPLLAIADLFYLVAALPNEDANFCLTASEALLFILIFSLFDLVVLYILNVCVFKGKISKNIFSLIVFIFICALTLHALLYMIGLIAASQKYTNSYIPWHMVFYYFALCGVMFFAFVNLDDYFGGAKAAPAKAAPAKKAPAKEEAKGEAPVEEAPKAEAKKEAKVEAKEEPKEEKPVKKASSSKKSTAKKESK